MTKRVVDAFQVKPSDRETFLFDDQMPEFGVRRMLSGITSWIIQHRNTFDGTRRMTLGMVGVVTPDQARTLAKDKLTATAHGADPSAKRSAARKAITVTELCDQYLEAAEGRFGDISGGTSRGNSRSCHCCRAWQQWQ